MPPDHSLLFEIKPCFRSSSKSDDLEENLDRYCTESLQQVERSELQLTDF